MSRPQRLVLRVKDREATVGDFILFMQAMEREGLPRDGKVEIVDEIDEDGVETRYFYAPLPGRKKRATGPVMTPGERAIQEAADRQIKRREEAIRNGEPLPGYIPPAQPKRIVKVSKRALARVQNGSASNGKCSTDS